MSETKHTPGPWMALTGEVTGILDQASVVHDPGKNKEYVFIAETADIDETLPLVVRVANARLIAAAPEMLEALKDGLTAFELFMKHANWGASALTADAIRGANEMPGKMRSAIAKAESRNV